MKTIHSLFFLLILTFSLSSFSQTSHQYLQINYGSICCGPPSEEPVLDFIRAFELEHRVGPFEMFAYEGLGDEGEFCYYVGLDNLDAR